MSTDTTMHRHVLTHGEDGLQITIEAASYVPVPPPTKPVSTIARGSVSVLAVRAVLIGFPARSPSPQLSYESRR